MLTVLLCCCVCASSRICLRRFPISSLGAAFPRSNVRLVTRHSRFFKACYSQVSISGAFRTSSFACAFEPSWHPARGLARPAAAKKPSPAASSTPPGGEARYSEYCYWYLSTSVLVVGTR